jgi:hypothetical protein
MTLDAIFSAGEADPAPVAHVDPRPAMRGAVKPEDSAMLERFLARTEFDSATGCLEWTGARNTDGYGAIREGKVISLAHRVSVRMCCGPIPRGMVVMHLCDNPGCVNPEHLRVGTSAENNLDALQKGHRPARAIPLTQEEADVILKMAALEHLNSNFAPEGIARLFCVNLSDVRFVLKYGRPPDWKTEPVMGLEAGADAS